jgi:hypothetical protein
MAETEVAVWCIQFGNCPQQKGQITCGIALARRD